MLKRDKLARGAGGMGVSGGDDLDDGRGAVGRRRFHRLRSLSGLQIDDERGGDGLQVG
ncbi:MAG: hypothetical protein HC853_13970, partial [Anaerolineae bacterium]|nr:hypothetical protein [Anaerolineae bacterium]